jgi:hypothetical protein
MSKEFPSDDLPLRFDGEDRTLGEARDMLDNYHGIRSRDRQVKEIANGLVKLVQALVDRPDGLQRLHPEEIKRREAAAEHFLNATPAEFPDEDRRLLGES